MQDPQTSHRPVSIGRHISVEKSPGILQGVQPSQTLCPLSCSAFTGWLLPNLKIVAIAYHNPEILMYFCLTNSWLDLEHNMTDSWFALQQLRQISNLSWDKGMPCPRFLFLQPLVRTR